MVMDAGVSRDGELVGMGRSPRQTPKDRGGTTGRAPPATDTESERTLIPTRPRTAADMPTA